MNGHGHVRKPSWGWHWRFYWATAQSFKDKWQGNIICIIVMAGEQCAESLNSTKRVWVSGSFKISISFVDNIVEKQLHFFICRYFIWCCFLAHLGFLGKHPSADEIWLCLNELRGSLTLFWDLPDVLWDAPNVFYSWRESNEVFWTIQVGNSLIPTPEVCSEAVFGQLLYWCRAAYWLSEPHSLNDLQNSRDESGGD